MEYNELARQIHQDQKEAGWYDELRSDNTLILLIKSELFEAFEAYRKRPIIQAFDSDYLAKVLRYAEVDNRVFTATFISIIKDTFQDELADMVIRLLDFAGYKELDLVLNKVLEIEENVNILTALVHIDNCLSNLYYEGSMKGEYILFIIHKIEALANYYEIDLETHIKLKLAYNKTRGKRHGNKAV